MLTRCANCGFYVTNVEKSCPNCGVKKFGDTFGDKTFQNLKTALPFALFFAVFAAILVGFSSSGNLAYDKLFVVFLVSFIISSTLIYVFVNEKREIQIQNERSKSKIHLDAKENIIRQRVAELTKRGQKIDAVVEKIKDTDGQNLQKVRRQLLSAREIVISQFARYELQKRKIELVRLQNNVLPYLYKIHRLNEIETEDGLSVVVSTQDKIGRIKQDLTSCNSIEFPERTQAEKENFLGQLEETSDSCEKLREVFLSRQAVRALQNISVIEENLAIPNSKETVQAADTFNIQTTLTDFSESFEQLEREYRRVAAENETELISDI